MRRKRDWGPLLLATALAAALLLLPAAAYAAKDGHAVLWWAADGGGGRSKAGSYTVAGSAGQPDADTHPATGGGYTLRGGAWHGHRTAGTEIPVAAVALTYGAGTDPDHCATSPLLIVPEGKATYFCVTLHNTGNVTLTHHQIVEPGLALNTIVTDTLAPDASLVLTHAALPQLASVATLSVTSVITVTAMDANPTIASPSAIAEAVGSVTIVVRAKGGPSGQGPGDEEPKVWRYSFPLVFKEDAVPASTGAGEGQAPVQEAPPSEEAPPDGQATPPEEPDANLPPAEEPVPVEEPAPAETGTQNLIFLPSVSQ